MNNIYKAFIFMALTLLLLLSYSILHENVPFLKNNFKNIGVPDMLSFNFKSSVNDNSALVDNNSKSAKTKKSTEKETLKPKAINPQLVQYKANLNFANSRVGLESFIIALNELKSTDKQLRIAHFGDSMIEGDLITMSLRKYFQRDFGGRGVGYVPIYSITNEFRSTIKHKYSSNWVSFNPITTQSEHFTYSINAELFTVDEYPAELEVNYSTVKRDFLSDFPSAYLFYGKNDSVQSEFPNTLIYNGIEYNLPEDNLLNIIKLSGNNEKQIDLTFKMNHQLPIYGMSFESSSGVIVDNFSMRGSSGAPLYQVPDKMVQSYNAKMDYSLIILQFGSNVLNENTDYNWYKNIVSRMIRHFKRNIPSASILVVSMIDRSIKSDDNSMITDPSVYTILRAQSDAAAGNDVAFLNLFEQMGGEGSMARWVDELELANKDYLHINFNGASQVATYIYDFIISEYNKNASSN